MQTLFMLKNRALGLGVLSNGKSESVGDRDSRHEARFWSACFQFFIDNVLIMVAAATGGITYGTLGDNSGWTPSDAQRLAVQGVSVVINFALLLVLRAILIKVWKRFDSNATVQSLVVHAIMYLLPWMPRVVGSNLTSALADFIMHETGAQEACRLTLAPYASLSLLFLVSFSLCSWLKYLTMRGEHTYGPEASLKEYLIQVAFGCMSTMAGKSLFYVLGLVLNFSEAGERKDALGWTAEGLEQLTFTAFTGWVLGCLVARVKRGAKNTWQLAQVETIAYVVGYWWSFVRALRPNPATGLMLVPAARFPTQRDGPQTTDHRC